MPRDIRIDENFEVFIDHTGDLADVNGRAEFEQRVRKVITELYQEVVGEYEPKNIRSMITLQAERVARRTDEIDEISGIDIDFSNHELGQIQVDIIYDLNNTVSFGVEA
jgi:hypothetical protein